MNNQLLTALGIDASRDLKSILEGLEEKQFEYLERLETVNNEERRQELTEVLQQIEAEIGEVKKQIEAISTSVILDTLEEKPAKKDKKPFQKKDETPKEKTPEEKAKEEKKEKEEKISAKVEELKKAVEEAREKEAERKRKEAEATSSSNTSNTQNSNTQNTQGTAAGQNGSATSGGTAAQPAPGVSTTANGASSTSGSSGSTQDNSDEFNKGVLAYKKQNYKEAFQLFKEISEKKGRVKNKAAAQYFVAQMYSNGKGVDRDEDRGNFWLKKAAEGGDTEAQFAYGTFLLSKNDNDYKRIKNGFKHLAAAAKKDDEKSMRKYIEAVKNQLGGKKEVKKAIEYCDRLKAKAEDSFNKQQFDETKKQLKTQGKGKKKYKKKKPFILKVAVLAGIVWVAKYGLEHHELLDDVYQYVNDMTGQEVFPLAVSSGNTGTSAQSSGNKKDVADNANSGSGSSTSNNSTAAENTEGDTAAAPFRLKVTADKAANIRNGVGTEDTKVLTTIKRGEELLATGTTAVAANGGLWYEVYLNEEKTETGWISDSIVEVVD